MAAMSTSSLKTLAALSLRRSHSLTHSLPHRALSLLSPLPPSPHSLPLSPPSPSLTLPTRGFKSTPYFEFAKKKKGGKGGKGGECESEGDAPAPPDIKQVEVQMEQRLTHLREEFSRMHNSRVSKDMFNHVMVEAYGSKSAVPECGQVSVQTASKVVINVFDAAIVPAVTKALRDCGLNLNPIVDGSMVSVPIPKASKEKREDMVKLAKKAGEKVCTCMVDK
jgi:hypothetical protein